MSAEPDHARLSFIVEALLVASDEPLSLDRLQRVVGDELALTRRDLRAALSLVEARYSAGVSELREVASGWRLQVRTEYAGWVARLAEEKPPRMTRAALETLALIVYRQPITRGEIEEIRGVAVSSNILRALVERGWVREVGVREAPGRPALFGTAPAFLDDFGLKSLDELPPLPDLKDADKLDAVLAAMLGESSPDDAPMDGDANADPEAEREPPVGRGSEAAEDLGESEEIAPESGTDVAAEPDADEAPPEGEPERVPAPDDALGTTQDESPDSDGDAVDGAPDEPGDDDDAPVGEAPEDEAVENGALYREALDDESLDGELPTRNEGGLT